MVFSSAIQEHCMHSRVVANLFWWIEELGALAISSAHSSLEIEDKSIFAKLLVHLFHSMWNQLCCVLEVTSPQSAWKLSEGAQKIFGFLLLCEVETKELYSRKVFLRYYLAKTWTVFLCTTSLYHYLCTKIYCCTVVFVPLLLGFIVFQRKVFYHKT